MGREHLRGCRVILVAPDDANRRGYAVELLDEVQHARAVAGDTGVIAQPDRLWTPSRTRNIRAIRAQRGRDRLH